ncbi:MAG TPA: DUF167 domain-containing protein [Parafilimonas sp.]|nr:DUF167 domain-containing protein [Parafilimonas sp.]
MILHLRVKPNSKVDSLEVKGDGTIAVKICAPAVEGKANKYLVRYLSDLFKIRPSKINIIKGQNNPHKTISIEADEKYVKEILSALRKA